MSITKRLGALEQSRNGSPAQAWLMDLLEELENARLQSRTPAPRTPSIKENTDIVVTLKQYGINLIIDTGESDW